MALDHHDDVGAVLPIGADGRPVGSGDRSSRLGAFGRPGQGCRIGGGLGETPLGARNGDSSEPCPDQPSEEQRHGQQRQDLTRLAPPIRAGSIVVAGSPARAG